VTTALHALAEEARALAAGEPVGSDEAEAARQLQICNACRYCEGFCAVFPAMTRRLEFPAGDVHYLANLCHNCGACLHACQYAPPHEFAVNLPRAMARVRAHTYEQYAWPRPLGALFARNGLVLSLALALSLSGLLVAALVRTGSLAAVPASGDFYAVFPHGWLVGLFGPVFGFALLALGVGVVRFWRDQAPPREGEDRRAAVREAGHDALVLTYLDGGHGEGCHNEDDRWTHARRRAHHLTVWGFGLCFAATSVATLYHYLGGWVAPYDLPSLPKLLGVAGGIGLLLGPAALVVLRLRRDPAHGDPGQRPMDLGFAALLWLCGATGLASWLARGHAGQTLWLAVHLGCVLALFVTLPYGKFAHVPYRVAALLKHAIERRQPDRLRLGGE
jgi:citrate/tricarballylate utilization protein